jgi:hypothetical protein
LLSTSGPRWHPTHAPWSMWGKQSPITGSRDFALTPVSRLHSLPPVTPSHSP